MARKHVVESYFTQKLSSKVSSCAEITCRKSDAESPSAGATSALHLTCLGFPSGAGQDAAHGDGQVLWPLASGAPLGEGRDFQQEKRVETRLGMFRLFPHSLAGCCWRAGWHL